MKRYKVSWIEISDGYNGYDHEDCREEEVEARDDDSAVNKMIRKYKNKDLRRIEVELIEEN